MKESLKLVKFSSNIQRTYCCYWTDDLSFPWIIFFPSFFRYTIFASHMENISELATIYPNVKILHFHVDLKNNHLDFKVLFLYTFKKKMILSTILFGQLSASCISAFYSFNFLYFFFQFSFSLRKERHVSLIMAFC